ncbi:MAG TPA: SMP-30/gluconolactonase/LRE family protein [Ohtaekwangia sp.]|uniref:SMP-30/gluconolactonase/LRE family protein n=1 Tax=Ohtaekwangia sp. TaxID=2066019 RepID=UPI002F94DDCC
MKEVEVVLDYQCYLGEGPVWDDQRKSILWIDIMQGDVHEYIPASRQHRKVNLSSMVGAVALQENGNLVAALKSGIYYMQRDSGALERLMHPEAHIEANRFNDGKCDADGRFWIGSMALSEEYGAGNLYRVDRDLSYTKVLDNVSLSNGLTWSHDNRTFYYIDTPTQQVVAFDFDIRSGIITHKRVIITIPETDGFPDGMTIDTEGMLWIAHWGGWQVSRWNPTTGEKIYQFQLPVAHVSSCAFGGDDFRDLYITSARKGLSEEALQQQPLAGSLFVIRNCGFQGSAPHRFRPHIYR